MSVMEFPGSVAGVGLILPPVYDLIWSVVPVLLAVPFLALWAGAIVSITNHRDQLAGLELLGWLAFVTFAPVLGPFLWFLVGRSYTRERVAAPPERWPIRRP